jgi:hypothetical protein
VISLEKEAGRNWWKKLAKKRENKAYIKYKQKERQEGEGKKKTNEENEKKSEKK